VSPLSSLIDRYRRLSLGVEILIFMMIGVVAGLLFGERATVVQPLGDLFIRLLLMAAIPLVFFNLLAALTGLSDARVLGRLGVKIIAYYLLTTTFALSLGLGFAHWFAPGRGIELTEEVPDSFGDIPTLTDVFLDLVPSNVVAAFAEGNVAQVVVFALLLGLASFLLADEQRKPVDDLTQSLAELFRKLVGLILRIAPLGIGALAAATIGQYGGSFFGPLAKFIGTVWSAQFVMVGLYLTLLIVMGRMSPARFLQKTGPLYATAAATCSSLASLSVSLDLAEKRLKLPRSVYAFTLPLGAQLNKDGTSVMLSAILIFTAQAASVSFDLSTQITILVVGLILSEGSGGIPGGGLVSALIFVEAFQLPLEIAAIVGGIYRLIDMGSTTVNVMGDMVGTILVARSEGHAVQS
jgi:Na+/H+-dicarboxylate symporter